VKKSVVIFGHEDLAKVEGVVEINCVLFKDAVTGKVNMASVTNDQIGTSMEDCWNAEREGTELLG